MLCLGDTKHQFIQFSGFEVWNNHLLLKNSLVTYVKTESVLGWERHNVSTSKEKKCLRKTFTENRRMDIQKNRLCALSGANYTKNLRC